MASTQLSYGQFRSPMAKKTAYGFTNSEFASNYYLRMDKHACVKGLYPLQEYLWSYQSPFFFNCLHLVLSEAFFALRMNNKFLEISGAVLGGG